MFSRGVGMQMSRRNDAPSVRIIDHKKYILEKRNLLCEVNLCNSKVWIDMLSYTIRLYHPQGKAFILETQRDLTGNIMETLVISKEKAWCLMHYAFSLLSS